MYRPTKRIVIFSILTACGVQGCQRSDSNVPDSQGSAMQAVTVPVDDLPSLIPQEGSDAYRQTFAVVIGIDEYGEQKTDLEPLQFAVNDAREIRDLLRDEFGYVEEQIRYLAAMSATREAIREVFEKWLPNQNVQPD